MINILFIAFEFPPLKRGGVYRPIAFARELPKYGINPIVLTLSEKTFPNVYPEYTLDYSIWNKDKDKLNVIEIDSSSIRKSGFSEFLSIYFSIYGKEVDGWRDAYWPIVEDCVAKYNPQLVLATIPPFSALKIAHETAHRFKLPIIYDFRDAWSQWTISPYGSIFHYYLTVLNERRHLQLADKVVVTSKQTIEDFKRVHPGISADKFVYIPNGYSEELNTWKDPKFDKSDIIIGYVGSFYYSPDAREMMFKPWWKKRGHRMLQYVPNPQDWLYRSPYFFFRAMKRLEQVDKSVFNRIKIRFAGSVPQWLPTMIEEFGLSHKIELLGEIPHKESQRFQESCDLLLITSAKQLNGLDYSIAGKTFEYLQMQKPILAFVCEGAQKELLEESGCALICDPDNEGVSAQKIFEYIQHKIKLAPKLSFVQSLSRFKLTEELAKIILTLCSQ